MHRGWAKQARWQGAKRPDLTLPTHIAALTRQAFFDAFELSALISSSATLTAAVSQQMGLSAQMNAQATLSAAISQRLALYATASAQPALSCALSMQMPLSATCSAVSTLTGYLSLTGWLPLPHTVNPGSRIAPIAVPASRIVTAAPGSRIAKTATPASRIYSMTPVNRYVGGGYMAIIGTATKQPADTEIIAIDNVDLFTGHTVTMWSATLTATPAGLTFRGPYYVGDTCRFYVDGGTNLVSYKLTADISYTTNGEILHAQDEVTLLVEEV